MPTSPLQSLNVHPIAIIQSDPGRVERMEQASGHGAENPELERAMAEGEARLKAAGRQDDDFEYPPELQTLRGTSIAEAMALGQRMCEYRYGDQKLQSEPEPGFDDSQTKH